VDRKWMRQLASRRTPERFWIDATSQGQADDPPDIKKETYGEVVCGRTKQTRGCLPVSCHVSS
jgi:hypothetical protein